MASYRADGSRPCACASCSYCFSSLPGVFCEAGLDQVVLAAKVHLVRLPLRLGGMGEADVVAGIRVMRPTLGASVDFSPDSGLLEVTRQGRLPS